MAISVKKNQHEVLFRGVIGFTALSFAWIFLTMPYMLDDFWYMEGVRDFKYGNTAVFPFREIWETVRFHYQTDNARLSNAVFAAILWLPRWIPALVTSLLNACVLLLLAKLAGIAPRRSPMAVVWLCLLYSVTLPWSDGIFILCFQFNYVWSTALSMLCLVLFLREKPAAWWLSALLGLLIGAWHEGFSAPLLCALALVSVLWPRRFLRPWRIAMMAGLAVSLLWLMSAPPFFRYAGDGVSCFSEPERWFRCMRLNMVYVFQLAMMVVALLRRSTRKAAWAPLPVACAVAGAVSCLIFIYVPTFPRVGFMAGVVAVPGILYLFPVLFSSVGDGGLRFRLLAVFTAFAGLFLAVHMLAADVAALQFRNDIERSRRLADESPDGSLFMDFSRSEDAPFITLGKPMSPRLEDFMSLDVYFRNLTGYRGIYPVPSELEYVTACSGMAVEGHHGLRKLGRRFFIAAEDAGFPADGKPMVRVMVRFGDRKWKPRSIMTFGFVSRADGRKYYYVTILDRNPFGRIWPVTAIDW